MANAENIQVCLLSFSVSCVGRMNLRVWLNSTCSYCSMKHHKACLFSEVFALILSLKVEKVSSFKGHCSR